MPTYDYRCKKCGHRFEQMMTLSQHEHRKQKPACPKCKSHAVEQVPAAFQAVTSSKS
ncbi:MAG: FmdB family zinc ribbon protein [Phycisphaeraceae bacterium]